MSERMSTAIVVKCLGRFAASLFLIGFATTCLLRLAPGFGVDEREIDARFSNAAIEELKENGDAGNIFADYGRFLREGARGEFGFSKSLNRPVRELIQQRYPTSVRILLLGLAAGWLCAFLVATAAAVLQSRVVSFGGTLSGGVILCLPSALIAYLCYLARAPAFLVVGFVIFARVFRVIDNLFRSVQQETHVLAARASGVSEFRIFTKHVLSATWAEGLALAAASVSMAISATIAAESFCGEAGLGQLAWKAALARDLPLLLSLTLLIAAITLFCNRAVDMVVQPRSASV